MKEPPLRNFWEKCNGVNIPDHDKDRWAEDSIKMLKESPFGYVRSGDSLVIAVKDEDSIDVFDCIVRRTAKVKT